jgi:2-octaprenyl-6-methoxyphenol hydroxylase
MTAIASPTERSLAIIGAGPAGLALAIAAAPRLPQFAITLFDASPLQRDASRDGRTLAMSLGSVQWLQRLGVWPAERAEPILDVHVSQQAPSGGMLLGALLGEPAVRIRAEREGVPMLGAVLGYGALVATLQDAWLAQAAEASGRLQTRFGTPVAGLQGRADAVAVELESGGVERFDLAVVAEGGVFAGQARKALHHDYGQRAWVGTAELGPDVPAGLACERFTAHGPAALLPLPGRRAALVWCVHSADDPVAGLDDAQRLAVLNSLFPPVVGQLRSVSALKCFELGLNAERSLVRGRIVRIGNAAQTLHPVAGQGLNLGLRDAGELVRLLVRHGDIEAALRRLDWRRGPDRWATIFATDFLARSFTWNWPGAGAARGLGLAALEGLGPVKSALARHMMFGAR